MTQPVDVTRCPADLDSESKTIWKRTRNTIVADGRWRPEFSMLLERYVRSLERARFARDRVAAEGATTRGSQGQLVAHPDMRTMREAERDAHDYATALLLTPAARAKVTDVPKSSGASKFGGAFDGSRRPAHA